MQGFFEWVEYLYNELLDFLYRLLLTLITLLQDLLFGIFDVFMTAVEKILSGLASFMQPIDISQYITAIPPEVAGVMGLIGLPQAMVMITTAITVRLILQLIPFTRLGS
ncbi:hypothetical protein C942_00844 [Photobacterium marinum]|uniref:DUF2523 domain-containing protein n=1 Tax=Photobacterium marinum TaxID=1056511 RepID=L8JBY8_9GAMM|nr:DUF2523 family protein [Photobacterium marinum]ELR65758.1 hypothetical protein C942_00844 [Photobacterium marinum]